MTVIQQHEDDDANPHIMSDDNNNNNNNSGNDNDNNDQQLVGGEDGATVTVVAANNIKAKTPRTPRPEVKVSLEDYGSATATPTTAVVVPDEDSGATTTTTTTQQAAVPTAAENPVGMVYFHERSPLQPVDVDQCIAKLMGHKVIDHRTMVFVDSTFLNRYDNHGLYHHSDPNGAMAVDVSPPSAAASACLPPPSLGSDGDFKLVHWFVVQRVLPPVAADATTSSPSASSSTSRSKKKGNKISSSSSAAVDAAVVPPADAAVDAAVVPPADAAVDAAVPAVDAAVSAVVEEEEQTTPAAAAAATATAAGSSHLSANATSASSPSSVNSRFNGQFGVIQNTIIGVYMHVHAIASSASNCLLSYYGGNTIDVSHGKSVTRSILDFLSLYWYSPGRLLITYQQEQQQQAFSGWGQLSIVGGGSVSSTPLEYSLVNVTQMHRALHGAPTRNGVLKMHSYLLKHSSLSDAKKALRIWKQYCHEDYAKGVWSAAIGKPDEMLSGWPEPHSTRYESSIAFTEIYRLIKTAVDKRIILSSVNGSSASAAAADATPTSTTATVVTKKRKRSSKKAATPPTATDGEEDDGQQCEDGSAAAVPAAAVPAAAPTPRNFGKKSRLSRHRKPAAAAAAAAVTAAEPGSAAATAKSSRATIHKPMPIGPELVSFIRDDCGEGDKLVDGDKIPRPLFRTILWAYVKRHQLQNPAALLYVFPNDALLKILRFPDGVPTNSVDAFTMSRFVEWNFIKAAPTPLPDGSLPSSSSSRKRRKTTTTTIAATPTTTTTVVEVEAVAAAV